MVLRWSDSVFIFYLMLMLSGCRYLSQPTVLSSGTDRDNQKIVLPSPNVSTGKGIPIFSPRSDLDGVEFVIFSEEQAVQIMIGFFAEKSQGTWSPKIEDIQNMETAIKIYAQEKLDPDSLRTLKKYKRQYVGFVIDGQKQILGNFFCHDLEQDWRRDPVYVLDGGNCYFQAYYVVDEQRISLLMINGDA